MARLGRRRAHKPAGPPGAKTAGASPAPARPVRKAGPVIEGSMGIAQWTEILKEFPDYTQAYVERGICLYKANRLDNALYDFNMALKLAPGDGKTLFYRASTYLAYGRFKEAAADFKRCIPHDKGNPEAYYYCGLAHAKMKDLAGALPYLDQAIERKPDHGKALALRGDLLVRLKQHDRAAEDLNRRSNSIPRMPRPWPPAPSST